MDIRLSPFDSPIKLLTLDTETTGLDPEGGDEILTLGMVLDIEGEASPSTAHLRVRPELRTEWPSAQRVNDISPESVKGLKSFSSYRPAVQLLIDRAEAVLGWNVGFDLAFLEKEGIRLRSGTEVIDAMEEFGRAFGSSPTGHFRWRLTDAVEMAGYRFDGRPHDALADALATREMHLVASRALEADVSRDKVRPRHL